jgi:phosphocarrier protein
MRAAREVLVANELGLHARAAARFVQLAAGFQSRVLLRKDGSEVDGKSILGVLTLAATRGTTLTIVAEGEDAERAVEALAELVAERFGEAS